MTKILDFKQEIIKTISELSNHFENNEIAYLALTSKIENPLRDKIAYLLHEKMGNDFLICREFKTNSNKKVDLAILDMNKKIKCLIEFKAHSSMHKEKEYQDHIINDFTKISNCAENDTELYYIFFNNIVESKIPEKYYPSVKYYQRINSFLDKNPTYDQIEKNLKEYWKYYSKNSPEKKTEIVSIAGGNYSNIKLSILTFIYGPFNKNDWK